MTQHKPKKLERAALKILKASGLPFRIERGSRHHKIYVQEKMVCVLSVGSQVGKDTQMLERFIKQHKAVA